MGDRGKYNKYGIPIGPHPIGHDLDENGPNAKGGVRIQNYRVGGGDLEGMYLHHKQSPILCHQIA